MAKCLKISLSRNNRTLNNNICTRLVSSRLETKQKERVTIALITFVLADITLESLIWWLIVGLIAGFLASVVMRGAGYGIVGDIIAGLVGAFIGGWLFGALGISTGGGLLGSIIVAFIGACIFIALLRAISGGGRRRL